MFLASFFAIIIGFLLGLLGGGGSILTVPVLVYLVDIPAKSAIVMSLFVVGCTSLIATYHHARKDHVCWKTGSKNPPPTPTKPVTIPKKKPSNKIASTGNSNGQVGVSLESALVSLDCLLFFGANASSYIPAHHLKRGFGYFVLLLGSYLLYKEVNQSIILQIQVLIKDNREFIIGASSVIAFMLVYRLWAWLHTKSNKI
jgi:uncharacterized membrane protein YfcA